MRILHLFSNFRMTGPAEPAVNLCRMLCERGWDVTLACHKRPRTVEEDLADVAEKRGIPVYRGFHLTKHFRLFSNISDAIKLRRFLSDQQIDLMHVHMTNDHLVGGWAARRCERPVSIIRSSYEGGGLPMSLRNRLIIRKLTDALIACGRGAAEADARRFDISPERIFVAEGAIDTQRFDPDRELDPIRPDFGLSDEDFVVGIVARIQLRRRFEDLLEAVKLAAGRVPNLKLMIIGRGTKMKQAVVEPTHNMGLSDRVIFAGYHRGDDYLRVLKALDAKVFLMPGTDGSCRAVREAMAMGKPVIAADRGMLAEIVDDGETGFVTDDSPESLADAIVKTAGNEQLRQSMSLAALKKARTRFTLERQADDVETAYKAFFEQKQG